MSSHKCLASVSIPLSLASFASCLFRRLSKISRWSDPGSFQITASALHSRECEVLRWSLYPLEHSGSSKNKPLWTSKTNFLEAHLSRVGFSSWKAQCGSRTPYSLGVSLQLQLSSHKESTCNAGDSGSVPGSGRSTGERASLVVQLVKNPPTMRETWVLSLAWEDPLEMGKATHYSSLAWTIPWAV